MNWTQWGYLIDRIAASTTPFNMATWISYFDSSGKEVPATHVEEVKPNWPACDTVACMAGEAIFLMRDLGVPMPAAGPIMAIAGDWLGMTEEEREYVFRGYWTGELLEEITREEVLAFMIEADKRGTVFLGNRAQYMRGNLEEYQLAVL